MYSYPGLSENISHPSKTTVAQKCSGAMEIQKCDGPTDGLTWVGARDTCVSKNRMGRASITFAPPTKFQLKHF